MTSPRLPNELDIVRDISVRLERGGVPFMLTGSLAMSYYAEPRMTRDVDIVIAAEAAEAPRIVTLLETDYYVDAAAVAEGIMARTSFNAIHREGVIKVDCFPLRDVRNLLAGDIDDVYVNNWVARLELASVLSDAKR